MLVGLISHDKLYLLTCFVLRAGYSIHIIRKSSNQTWQHVDRSTQVLK